MNEIETFLGPIESTADALRVFELCRQGRLGRVRRRLHEKERRLIRTGSVFVFDENESGIRRWTDGRLWSPSRILGNFLIYRELERKALGGGGGGGGNNDSNSRPLKRLQPDNRSLTVPPPLPPPPLPPPLPTPEAASNSSEMDSLTSILPWLAAPIISSETKVNTRGGVSLLLEQESYESSSDSSCIDPSKVLDYNNVSRSYSFSSEGCANSLLGPNSFRLLKSKKLQATGAANGGARYVFKPDGLIKKTISARVDGRMQHLVCYFSEADFITAHSTVRGRPRQQTPLMEELRRTRIPADLVLQQNFRKQPTTELGVPIIEANNRVRRRHSMHVPMHHRINDIPIFPRVPSDLMALDLASNWSILSSSSPSENVQLLAEPNDLDPLMEPLQSSNTGEEGPQPSTNNIMEECIRMVLGETASNSTLHSLNGASADTTPAGLSFHSHDPALPIVERPDSVLPFQ